MAVRVEQEKVFKKLSQAGNILFWLGLASAIYTFITIYVLSGSLASGACPLTAGGPWPYISIGLLALSFILSLFDRKKKGGSHDPQV